MDGSPPNPYLVRETGSLVPGTALEAGCGAGAEAIWLASRGWQVTAADIAAGALARAAGRAADSGVSDRVRWVEADLTAWDPGRRFDLVTTHYAHPAIPQLAFYDRVSAWVAPGGTLLIVGHLHASGATGHGHHPPAEASATLADITAGLDSTKWTVATAAEHIRTVIGPGGQAKPLHDVVVRATRRPGGRESAS
jgi:SAM-dependent methyltransferase